MFIHDTHLPQRLGVEFYTSPELLETEIESMFLPGWHCIGATSDVPRDGDYLTADLFGRPVICWRSQGELHTFLNVCTHRFSMLRSAPCGHLDGRLKCQYHGWEYDENGDTCRIPDARSFRPMEKGKLGLTKFRTETAGQLIFTTLDDDAPPLPEFLGEYLFDMCRRWFSPDHRPTVNIDCHHECNWKVVIENVLEGYHVEEVHKRTFKTYPDEQRCTHEFHGFWDLYTDDYSQQGLFNRQERFVSRLAGVEPDFLWKHLLRYPNVVFGQMGLFTWVQMLYPVSATECRAMWRIFHYPGRPGRFRTWLAHRMLKGWGSRFMQTVVGEDAAIYPVIQRGIGAPDRPRNGGLISTREERIFAFQEHVLRSTGRPVPRQESTVDTASADFATIPK